MDRITGMPLYQSSGVIQDKELKMTLVKFRIGIIDNDNPSRKNLYSF